MLNKVVVVVFGVSPNIDNKYNDNLNNLNIITTFENLFENWVVGNPNSKIIKGITNKNKTFYANEINENLLDLVLKEAALSEYNKFLILGEYCSLVEDFILYFKANFTDKKEICVVTNSIIPLNYNEFNLKINDVVINYV